MSTERPLGESGAETSVFSEESQVPHRAVLTELARGFLLTHASDPDQAAQFAATFLREHEGTFVPGRVVSPRHIASVRKGVAAAVHESGRPMSGPVGSH
ncbi:MAG: hypothetical protein WCA77_06135 [Thermoplasmata archaeon]